MATTYTWQTLIFAGPTAQDATSAFAAWHGAYTPPSGMGARPNIRETANQALYYYMTHVPGPGHYEIHVTALMPTPDTDKGS